VRHALSCRHKILSPVLHSFLLFPRGPNSAAMFVYHVSTCPRDRKTKKKFESKTRKEPGGQVVLYEKPLLFGLKHTCSVQFIIYYVYKRLRCFVISFFEARVYFFPMPCAWKTQKSNTAKMWGISYLCLATDGNNQHKKQYAQMCL